MAAPGDPHIPEYAAQLAAAGMALMRAETDVEVFDVVRDFLAEAIGEHIAIVSPSTGDARHYVVHSLTGMDSSMLARAASIGGFQVVGKPSVIKDAFLHLVFVRSLQKVEGGFEEFAGNDMRPALARAAAKALGLRDVHIVGITDGSTVYGNVSIITRTPDAVLPAAAIESLVYMAFLTLSKIHGAQELAASEQRCRMMFDQSPDGIVILDPEAARPVEFNEAAHRQLGYTREEFAALTLTDIEDMESPEDTRAHIAEVVSTGRSDFETRQRAKSGEIRNVRVTAQVTDVGGQPVYHCVWSDVTDRRQAETSLRESEQKYRTLTESMADVVWTLDPETLRFTYVSPSVTRLRGYTPEEILAEPMDAALTPEGAAEIRRIMEIRVAKRRAGVIGNDSFFTSEVDQPRKDGSLVSTDVVTSFYLDERTGHIEIRGVTRDITERRAAEAELAKYRRHLEALVEERTASLAATNEELRRTNEQLREATEAKNEFLASMSHELRTPLNSIIGFSGIMSQGLAGHLNDEQSRQMEMVNRSGRHLLSLIDNVLDLAKVEAGRTVINMDAMDPDVIVREVAEAVRPLAAEKGLKLEVLTCGSGAMVLSDAGKVRQVLFNLVGNAVKFTDVGSVHVAVHCVPGGSCTYVVADTGPGIAAADLSMIFESFTQLESRTAAKPQGTGLGLRLAREYAHLLGGEITVTSELGEGSVFTLTLPPEPPSPAATD